MASWRKPKCVWRCCVSAVEDYDEAVRRYDAATADYAAISEDYERHRQSVEATPDDEAARATALAVYERLMQSHAELTVAAEALEQTEAARDSFPNAESAIPAPNFDSTPLVTVAPSQETAVPEAPTDGILLARGTSVRMIPVETEANNAGVMLRRNLLQPTVTDHKPEISRNRKIAGNLPEWSPMPPGEIQSLGIRRES